MCNFIVLPSLDTIKYGCFEIARYTLGFLLSDIIFWVFIDRFNGASKTYEPPNTADSELDIIANTANHAKYQ